MADKLYKYLDTDGGVAMLYNKTLQFANATQMNDPLECHPAFINLPADASGQYRGIPADFYSQMEYQKGLNCRDKTYICSLSKVFDSITMWSYYNKHQGVCIGLDMEKTRPYLKKMMGMIVGCTELDVAYRDIIADSIPLSEPKGVLRYFFATKAKDWQHEQEVRLVSYDPAPMYMRLPAKKKRTSIKEFFKEKKPIDWKEVRAYLEIGRECFESIFLGLSMSQKDKENIIKVARECNPNIKIYQMTIDPMALKLKGNLIDNENN